MADTYTIMVGNAGLGPTTGTVTVTDTLPAGLTFKGISGTDWTLSSSSSGQTVIVTNSDIVQNGASFSPLVITVAVADNAPASVTNMATVAGGGELNTTNDSVSDITAITQVADLTITKTDSGNFHQGDTADTYTITVKNNSGSGPTSGLVTVTDPVPSGVTPTAASGTGWTTSISGQTVTATRSDALAAGSSYPALMIKVSVASNAPASVTNIATVSGGGEINTSNDTGSDTTPIAVTNVATSSLAGYVYIDANNTGQRITSTGQTKMGVPNATVNLYSQNSSGNWVAVAGESAIVTGQNGYYQFTGLSAAKYEVKITPPSGYIDGQDTAGIVNGVTLGTAGTDEITAQLSAGQTGTEYDFGMRGIKPSAAATSAASKASASALAYLFSSSIGENLLPSTSSQLSAAAVNALLASAVR